MSGKGPPLSVNQMIRGGGTPVASQGKVTEPRMRLVCCVYRSTLEMGNSIKQNQDVVCVCVCVCVCACVCVCVRACV